MNLYLSLLISISLLLGILPHASAFDATSTNFTLRDPVFNIFAGTGTSTSFQNLQSGGENSIGIGTSTNFILRSGSLYFTGFNPVNQNWRWYDDAENETPVTALADENVAPSDVANQNTIKLRMSIKELAGVAGTNVKYRLQYSTSSDFSTGALEPISSSNCSTTSTWCYADGGGADNGVIDAKVLSDADSCSGGSGNGCGTHNEASSTTTFDHPKDAATEFEFAIKPYGAEYNRTYFFRVYESVNATSVPKGTGETYPSLSIQGVTFTFTINGVSTSVATEGITTDATSTAVTVPFGTLTIDGQKELAQSLVVTTSANEGYQIFVFERTGLLNVYSSAILPVTGTNASPSGWTAGCLATSTGCYGYHAGDDALSGGSTRFSANDTYAALDSTAREIAYSSLPVTSETTDIIYKMQITNQQEAGSYSGSVVYIAVPTF
ncbi:hypothetical protein A3A21_01130 [Candidatus Jorgensenbacteria bacterium RIFCSPLOWO2_01_FULL_45_25b]|uniref:Uncharacterized protein n=1 Tax=Candidatus Jorgensenbacteria bacterium RIFCSPLOWO2_01_FULL_45_25b TaxID=1798471 RepID=A0A1F6BV40_9BACT|nr:MAG: hypothetical protein A3A21_01130 [Candidatus Jorgensenbacteria bacterium RIFCSPLOWO2_01_FULL_45_25b]